MTTGPASETPSLIGDIGGTNARFALVSAKASPTVPLRLAVAEYPAPEAAIAAALAHLSPSRPVGRMALAIAGPIDDGRGGLTNGSWQFDAMELRSAFDLSDALLLNDLEATAHGLPLLGPVDCVPIGQCASPRSGGMAVVAPGTGLGIAGWLPSPEGGAAIVGEGGHVTMPARDAREAELLAILSRRWDHVSAERLLSGQGLANLHDAIVERDGVPAAPHPPERITAPESAAQCAACRETLDVFCAMLGTLAGDVALTLGARGGVFLAGGILPRIRECLITSRFRERFVAKGRFEAYLNRIPTWLVVHPEPVLLGLQAALASVGRRPES